jgi:hypothetical protein
VDHSIERHVEELVAKALHGFVEVLRRNAEGVVLFQRGE